jgi:hypothetical protein
MSTINAKVARETAFEIIKAKIYQLIDDSVKQGKLFVEIPIDVLFDDFPQFSSCDATDLMIKQICDVCDVFPRKIMEQNSQIEAGIKFKILSKKHESAFVEKIGESLTNKGTINFLKLITDLHLGIERIKGDTANGISYVNLIAEYFSGFDHSIIFAILVFYYELLDRGFNITFTYKSINNRKFIISWK